ncbi:MAG: sigma-70 family RNA polymerase sigma factor [Mobilitalea sp.]
MDYSFGTNEYIQQVLEKYSTMLIKLAFTYLKNIADAEDVTQDVFVSLMRREKGFHSDDHEKAWLLRVTINKCKNQLKSARNRLNVPLEDDISYFPEEQSEVLHIVTDLPEKYRTVIHLYYYEEYSINEIAKMLAKRPATIGTWLARGRNLLKNKLVGGFEYE